MVLCKRIGYPQFIRTVWRYFTLGGKIAYIFQVLVINTYDFVFVACPYISASVLIDGTGVVSGKFRVLRMCGKQMEVACVECDLFQPVAIGAEPEVALPVCKQPGHFVVGTPAGLQGGIVKGTYPVVFPVIPSEPSTGRMEP